VWVSKHEFRPIGGIFGLDSAGKASEGHIFHWIIRIYEIKIILPFCKRHCNLTNEIKKEH
jgi:hypothetical protein